MWEGYNRASNIVTCAPNKNVSQKGAFLLPDAAAPVLGLEPDRAAAEAAAAAIVVGLPGVKLFLRFFFLRGDWALPLLLAPPPPAWLPRCRPLPSPVICW